MIHRNYSNTACMPIIYNCPHFAKTRVSNLMNKGKHVICFCCLKLVDVYREKGKFSALKETSGKIRICLGN